jgi:NDP-sugar pyrophosphorylase family protein
LLETIISNYSSCGFNRFYLSVNYKAEVIEQYFGDGEKFGVEIKYLREKKRLGTAGPLGLIPEAPDQPIIIANGDLLTKADVGNMLDEHVANDSALTMAVREYEMQVPFGVVHGKNNVIVGFEEKPIHRFLVNAGIYVLSPNVLPLVPVNTFFDMPQLVDAVRKQKMVSRMHQIDGYWLDIGRLADYERANIEFNEVFL